MRFLACAVAGREHDGERGRSDDFTVAGGRRRAQNGAFWLAWRKPGLLVRALVLAAAGGRVRVGALCLGDAWLDESERKRQRGSGRIALEKRGAKRTAYGA